MRVRAVRRFSTVLAPKKEEKKKTPFCFYNNKNPRAIRISAGVGFFLLDIDSFSTDTDLSGGDRARSRRSSSAEIVTTTTTHIYGA